MQDTSCWRVLSLRWDASLYSTPPVDWACPRSVLSFTNTPFSLKFQAWELDLDHAKKVLSIKSQYLAPFSSIPSSTLNGPIIFWSTKYSTLFFSFLTPSIPAFSKIWDLLKNCFAITCFTLRSSLRSKCFLCLKFSTWLYFQQPSISFDDLNKAPLISSKWTFLNSVTLLFSVFQHLLDLSLYPCFNTYYGQKEKKSLSLDSNKS